MCLCNNNYLYDSLYNIPTHAVNKYFIIFKLSILPSITYHRVDECWSPCVNDQQLTKGDLNCFWTKEQKWMLEYSHRYEKNEVSAALQAIIALVCVEYKIWIWYLQLDFIHCYHYYLGYQTMKTFKSRCGSNKMKRNWCIVYIVSLNIFAKLFLW